MEKSTLPKFARNYNKKALFKARCYYKIYNNQIRNERRVRLK